MLASLALAVAVACAQAIVQVATVVARMVVVVAGVAQAVDAQGKERGMGMVQAAPLPLVPEEVEEDEFYDPFADPEDVWLDAETGTHVDSDSDEETEAEAEAETEQLRKEDIKIKASAVCSSKSVVDGYIVSDTPPSPPRPPSSTSTDPDPNTMPFTTPSASHEARGPYTGVGDKVADFVKRYKDMQAELIETKQRLAVAEDYKEKYEALKAEMDDILGNA